MVAATQFIHRIGHQALARTQVSERSTQETQQALEQLGQRLAGLRGFL